MQENAETLKARGHEIIEPAVTRLESLDDGVKVHFKDGTTRQFGMVAHQPPRELQARHLLDQLGLATKRLPTGYEVVEQQQMMGYDMGKTPVEGVYVAGDVRSSLERLA